MKKYIYLKIRNLGSNARMTIYKFQTSTLRCKIKYSPIPDAIFPKANFMVFKDSLTAYILKDHGISVK